MKVVKLSVLVKLQYTGNRLPFVLAACV